MSIVAKTGSSLVYTESSQPTTGIKKKLLIGAGLVSAAVASAGLFGAPTGIALATALGIAYAGVVCCSRKSSSNLVNPDDLQNPASATNEALAFGAPAQIVQTDSRSYDPARITADFSHLNSAQVIQIFSPAIIKQINALNPALIQQFMQCVAQNPRLAFTQLYNRLPEQLR